MTSDMDFGEEEARDRQRIALAVALAAFAIDRPVRHIMSHARGDNATALARQVAMYLAHVAFEMSLARVALAFRRDRSTVAHACHRMEDRRDDGVFDQWLDQLEAAARAAPVPQADEEVAA